MQASSIAISGPKRLAIRFRKAYTPALQFCQRSDRKATLEQALASLAGEPWQIEFETLPDESDSASVRAAPQPVQNRRQRLRLAEKHPLVRSAIELFDAEVVSVLEPVRAEENETTSRTTAGEAVADVDT